METSPNSKPHLLQDTLTTYIKACSSVKCHQISDDVLQKVVSLLGSDTGPRLKIIAAATLAAVAENNMELTETLLRMDVLKSAESALASIKSSFSGNIELVSKVSGLLLNLMNSDPSCCKQIVQSDAIDRLISMCEIKNSTFFCYPSAAVDKVLELSRDKRLVANLFKQSDVTKTNLKMHLHEELHLNGSLAVKYCSAITCYQVELFDTTNPETDVTVRNELVEAGSIWTVDSDISSSVWDSVEVVHVLPNLNFFAHIGEKMFQQVEFVRSELTSENERRKLCSSPVTGQLVCCSLTLSGQSEFVRCMVVGGGDHTFTVLAVDYGRKFQVSAQDIYELPEKLKSIVPQVTFCSVKDAIPPPVSEDMLVAILKTICTVCQDVTAAEGVMYSKETAAVFFSLVNPSSPKVAELAVSIIANAARSPRIRLNLGQIGGVKKILTCCQKCVLSLTTAMSRVVKVGLNALTNLMFNCADNKLLFADLRGLELLLHLVARKDTNFIRPAAIKTLRIFVGQMKLSVDMLLKGDDVNSPVPQSAGSKPLAATKVESSSTRPDVASRHRRGRRRSARQYVSDPDTSPPSRRGRSASAPRVGGQRSVSRSRQTQSDSSSDEDTILSRGQYLSGDSEGETIIKRKGRSVNNTVLVDAARHYKEKTETVFFIQGLPVKVKNDSTHELRPTKDATHISSRTLSRIVVSFLNSGKGGSIYFGIDEQNVVQGILVDRNTRDEFRLGVDRLLNRFIPPVMHTMYDITYSPVVYKRGHADPTTREYVPDRYVIEVKISENYNKVYTAADGACYCRFGANTRQVSTQELREHIIIEQERLHLAEMRRLQESINRYPEQVVTSVTPPGVD